MDASTSEMLLGEQVRAGNKVAAAMIVALPPAEFGGALVVGVVIDPRVRVGQPTLIVRTGVK